MGILLNNIILTIIILVLISLISIYILCKNIDNKIENFKNNNKENYIINALNNGESDKKILEYMSNNKNYFNNKKNINNIISKLKK
jgi:predicted Holliday junction resolvase-like endonuclease